MKTTVEIAAGQAETFRLQDGSFGGATGSAGMVRPVTWDEIRDDIYQPPRGCGG